jgi:dynein assembly factor 5, axonemal
MPENIQQLPTALHEAEKHLHSAERMTRQTTLKQILEYCESDQLSTDAALIIYNQLYLNILKCYSDKFEMCRSLAGSIISALLQKLPDNDYYLSCLVPAIARRIGQKELPEESEEMRLQLLQQLNEIIQKFSPTEKPKSEKDDRFLKCYNDVIDILLRCLRDPFPAVQRECCALIMEFAAATTCFHYRAEILAEPLILMLRHRQSPIRIATIEALGVVVENIHSNGDCIAKVLTAIAPLLMDSIPFVRRACGRVGCQLMMELRDRYSYFDRILPLVLCW